MKKLFLLIVAVFAFCCCKSNSPANSYLRQNLKGPVKSVRTIAYAITLDNGDIVNGEVCDYMYSEENTYEEYNTDGFIIMCITFDHTNTEIIRENIEYFENKNITERTFADNTDTIFVTRNTKDDRIVSGELHDQNNVLWATEKYEYEGSRKTEMHVTHTLIDVNGTTLAASKRHYIKDTLRKNDIKNICRILKKK